jgi:hypothetical protein
MVMRALELLIIAERGFFNAPDFGLPRNADHPQKEPFNDFIGTPCLSNKCLSALGYFRASSARTKPWLPLFPRFGAQRSITPPLVHEGGQPRLRLSIVDAKTRHLVPTRFSLEIDGHPFVPSAMGDQGIRFTSIHQGAQIHPKGPSAPDSFAQRSKGSNSDPAGTPEGYESTKAAGWPPTVRASSTSSFRRTEVPRCPRLRIRPRCESWWVIGRFECGRTSSACGRILKSSGLFIERKPLCRTTLRESDSRRSSIRLLGKSARCYRGGRAAPLMTEPAKKGDVRCIEVVY